MANESKKFALGALIGSVVGATAALLFAPKSGKELREDVSTQMDNIKEKGIEIANTAKEKSTNLAQTAKEKSSDVKQYVIEQSDTLKNKLNNLKNEQETQDVQEKVEEEVSLTDDDNDKKTVSVE